MSIFNSLGSNHTFWSALRVLFATGGSSAQKDLIAYLETRYGGKAILVYKGREALRLALDSLPGEKGTVAVNGFTCWAVYQAVQESNNTCHYLDISDRSLNFSAETLRGALVADPSIRAVVIQNTLGIPCDIEPIAALCKEYGIPLIEDLAHSIGISYTSGKEAGSVGDFVILSFSQDKVVDAVAGGALVVRNKKYQGLSVSSPRKVTYTQQFKDRLYPLLTYSIRWAHTFGVGAIVHRSLRSLHLLSRPFIENDTNEPHELPGWYCTTILRAYAALEETMRHRKKIAQLYTERVDKRLQIPEDPRLLSRSANLRFPILHYERDGLIEYLKARHIYVSDIWYDAPIGPKRFLHRTDYRGQCPYAEDISRMMLNLPTHPNISAKDAERIAMHINEWLRSEGGKTYHVKPMWNEAEWEDFLRTQKPHSFLHSWKWGQHYERTAEIFRVGVYDAGVLVGIALFIKIRARRGIFLVCPHGPLFRDFGDEEGALASLVHYCADVGRDEECDFIRFCPLAPASDVERVMYRRLGFHDAPIHMHPELSWMLDITKSEDQLLKEMRKTTRYLIKRMEKEGVEITQSSDPADMDKFWSVYEKTFERQQFTPFSRNYLQTEFELFSKDDQAVFFFGKYQGELIAAAIIIFYNGQAFYHHSGSIQKFGDINASYLLQWRVIQEAKKRGCTLYNFWGIAPDTKPHHAWAGLSLFKKGFGGFAEAYLRAQDKPLSPKYALNYVFETARRIRRGL